MNKKILGMGLAAMMMAACSNGAASTSAGKEYKATVAGSDGTEYTAVLTKEDGKLTGVSIDAVDAEGKSKKEAGDDYGMKKASAINKEWYQQIEFLENYILEHGVDAVKLNAEGQPEGEDVKSGCTINLKDIMEAVNEANNESK
ncbi:MAG: hypothetical protein HUJ55_06430 [Ileibacterium sp.]|mgnify:FL=1|nr:hypothetical protein [Ileibacterium sp.]